MLTQQSPLILASASPRRRELLAKLGLEYTTRSADIDERRLNGETPADMALRLSMSKVKESARSCRGVIIGADTIVVLDKQILGKPQDQDEALEMLLALRSRAHSVLTGLSVYHTELERWSSEVVETRVYMRAYSDAEIQAYVATGDPLDKAGAYAVQNDAFCPVERFEGCYTNIVGLPLCRLQRLLSAYYELPQPPIACCSLAKQSGCTFTSACLEVNAQ